MPNAAKTTENAGRTTEWTVRTGGGKRFLLLEIFTFLFFPCVSGAAPLPSLLREEDAASEGTR